jgi:hypothetical protein
MWFKKGDEMQGDEQEEGEELEEVTAGDGSISDTEKEIHERYKDDGSITKEDQAQFSLRTGQTGMMPAVEMQEEQLPGKKMQDSEVVSSLDRGRRVWLYVGIVVFLLGAAAFGGYFYLSTIPDSFVNERLHSKLKDDVPDFEPTPRVAMPDPPTFPEGEPKQLWAKLTSMWSGYAGAGKKAPREEESAKKKEGDKKGEGGDKKAEAKEPKKEGKPAILPLEGHGVAHYLVAFEKKLVGIEKKMSEAKGRRRRRRRRRQASPFAPIVGRRRADKAAERYGEIRKRVVSELRTDVSALKGKVYTGGETEKWVRALQAARVLLALPKEVSKRDELEKEIARLKTNFKGGKKEAEPTRARAGRKPGDSGQPGERGKVTESFGKLEKGMSKKEAVASFDCVKTEQKVNEKKGFVEVTCQTGGAEGAEPAVVEMRFGRKSKKLRSARMKVGKKVVEMGGEEGADKKKSR